MSIRKGLLVGLVVLIGVVAALPFLVDANRFRGVVQLQLEKRLGRTVALGEMRLKVIPLSLRIADVEVGQPSGFASKFPFLAAKAVFVGVALWPLLRGEVVVQSVELQAPKVELIKSAAGKWNYETSDGAKGGDSAVPDLAVADGSVAVTDLRAKTPRDVYEHIDAGWRGNRQLDAKLQLDSMKAQAAVEATYENGAAKGMMTLQSQGAKSPLVLAFDLRRDGESWEVKELTAKLGAMALAVTGRVTGTALQLAVKTAQAPVGDLVQIAAIFGGKLPADLKVQGFLTADVAVKGSIDKPLLNGKLEASQAEFSSKELAAPVRASALRITMTPETLTTEPFTLETGGTKLLARATVRGYSDDDPKVEATLKTDGASVEELLRMASAYGLRPEGLTGKGTVTLDMRVTDTTYSGSGALRGVTLVTPLLPKPLEIAQANVKFAEGSVIFEEAQWALGGMHAKGMISVKNFAKPVVNFNAAVDQLNVAEWQEWKAPAGKSAGPPTITANGTITVGKVTFDGVPLEDVKATIAMSGGVLRMEPFTARVFGGEQAGSVTVDLRAVPSKFQVQSTMRNVEASQLLAATSSVKGVISGPLSGKLDLEFAPKPNEELARSLNGTMQLELANGRLNGVHMFNEMVGIGKLLGLMKVKETVTDIVKFGGTMQLASGVATTKDLAMDFGSGTLTGEGTFGLVDQVIKLRLTTVLGKEAAAKAGSGQLGGIMGAVFASPRGELVIPAIVTGTFSQPRFAPDAERAARLKVEGMGGLGEAAGSILDRFRKKK
ncbi:MAG: AsmA family protein [Acidobacteria bacterium]|nr:AsmA family protein [Acidobacteriota bacterium]